MRSKQRERTPKNESSGCATGAFKFGRATGVLGFFGDEETLVVFVVQPCVGVR